MWRPLNESSSPYRLLAHPAICRFGIPRSTTTSAHRVVSQMVVFRDNGLRPGLCRLIWTAGGLGCDRLTGTCGLRSITVSWVYKPVRETQLRFNSGLGIEALVGDKDEKIQGILRLVWMSDAQPKTPDTSDAGILPQHPDYDSLDNKNSGVLALGVQWGLLGDPADKQLVLTSIVGSGFITTGTLERTRQSCSWPSK